MLRPIGRLPAQVYWRRRLLFGGIALVAALFAGWLLIGAASGATGGPDVVADEPSVETTSAQPSQPLPLPGLEQVVPSLVPPESTGSGTAPPGSPPAPTTPPAPPAPPAPASEPVPPAPPAEPGPCPDEAIALAVGSELGQYAAGSKPLMGLAITNISAAPCLRDLDLALQTWGLFAADGARLWGSNDCFPEPSVPDPQLLQPGQVVAFSIIWSGRTSEPSCTVDRTVLGPGTYLLRGYLGNLVSPDVTLVLT